jgi:hypothetical protein
MLNEVVKVIESLVVEDKGCQTVGHRRYVNRARSRGYALRCQNPEGRKLTLEEASYSEGKDSGLWNPGNLPPPLRPSIRIIFEYGGQPMEKEMTKVLKLASRQDHINGPHSVGVAGNEGNCLWHEAMRDRR